MVFFGTLLVAVAVGACVPVLFGKETVGQLENFNEAAGVARLTSTALDGAPCPGSAALLENWRKSPPRFVNSDALASGRGHAW